MIVRQFRKQQLGRDEPTQTAGLNRVDEMKFPMSVTITEYLNFDLHASNRNTKASTGRLSSYASWATIGCSKVTMMHDVVTEATTIARMLCPLTAEVLRNGE